MIVDPVANPTEAPYQEPKSLSVERLPFVGTGVI